jgi:hypothetical protein
VAADADTKLVPSWLVGKRDTEYATIFIRDLARRLANRVQLTTDGHRPYLEAIEGAFGADIDYAQLIKLYGNTEDERRYSPGVCIGAEPRRVPSRHDPIVQLWRRLGPRPHKRPNRAGRLPLRPCGRNAIYTTP